MMQKHTGILFDFSQVISGFAKPDAYYAKLYIKNLDLLCHVIIHNTADDKTMITACIMLEEISHQDVQVIISDNANDREITIAKTLYTNIVHEREKLQSIGQLNVFDYQSYIFTERQVDINATLN